MRWSMISYKKVTRILRNHDLHIERREFYNLTRTENLKKLKLAIWITRIFEWEFRRNITTMTQWWDFTSFSSITSFYVTWAWSFLTSTIGRNRNWQNMRNLNKDEKPNPKIYASQKERKLKRSQARWFNLPVKWHNWIGYWVLTCFMILKESDKKNRGWDWFGVLDWVIDV